MFKIRKYLILTSIDINIEGFVYILYYDIIVTIAVSLIYRAIFLWNSSLGNCSLLFTVLINI